MMNRILSNTAGLARNTFTYNRSPINTNKNANKDASTKLMGLNDYKYLPSKITPPMSDDGFKKKMIEQAQKDAANNIYGGSEFKALEDSYVQVGSPNRVGIINSLMDVLLRNPPSQGLANALTSVYHPSGSPMSGSCIASYTPQQGWLASITPIESTRTAEINQVYREAWKEARGGDIGEGIVPGDNPYAGSANYRSTFSKTV